MIIPRTPEPRSRPSRIRVALAAAVAALACAAAPGEAAAGTYDIWQCSPPGLAAHDKGAWKFVQTGPGPNPARVFGVLDECSSVSSPAMVFGAVDGDVLGMGQWPGMELRLPAERTDVRIVSARLWGSAHVGAGGSWNVVSASRGGPVEGLSYCWAGHPGRCNDSGVPHRILFDGSPGFAPVEVVLPADADHLRIEDRCQGGGGGCSGPVRFALRGVELVLREDVQPAVAVDGGTLLEPGASGTRSVAFSASDPQSGVRRAQLLVDGEVRRTIDYASSCGYVASLACVASRSDTFAFATGELRDGRHAFAVRVTDAAGNSRTTPESTFTVDNVPDEGLSPVVVPQPVVPGPAGPAGRDGRDGQAGPGAPAGGGRTANGEGATPGARVSATFAATSKATTRAPYGQRVVITGSLLTPSGTPVVGARLDVHEQPKLMGALMTPTGQQVTTDRRGTFRYIAPVGVSRTIRFGYRAVLEDTAFSAHHDVELGVVAGITLRADRAKLRNGQAVRFTGRVLGAPSGVKKVVELQVRKGRSWMTFRSTRLREGGTFTESYRFTRTRRLTRYDFRARVREESGFPFLTGVSKAARVIVRG